MSFASAVKPQSGRRWLSLKRKQHQKPMKDTKSHERTPDNGSVRDPQCPSRLKALSLRCHRSELHRDVSYVRRDVPLVTERVFHCGSAVSVGLVGRFLE